MDVKEKYLVKGRRTASRIWDGTAVIVISKRGMCKCDIFELTPQATFIWMLLEKKPKVKEVIFRFAKKYKISRKAAQVAIKKFISNLSRKEIVELLNGVP